MDLRRNILGVHVSAINMDQALKTIDFWIDHGEHQYICVTSAAGIMDCIHNPTLRPIFNASGLTTPDGMSLVWLLKLCGQHNVRRVYGPDLMRTICKISVQKGWRHFLYGGDAGVPEHLKLKLESEYPGIQITGCYSPPFRPMTEQEDQEIVLRIQQAHPDILWVGISTPKQEQWMHNHLGRVNVNVMIGVGAAFDFLSGRKKQAPIWIQRAGLEWLFRLATEPRRLWRRYAQYPLFALLVFFQAIGITRYD